MSTLKEENSQSYATVICTVESIIYYTVCRWTFPLKTQEKSDTFYLNSHPILLTYIMAIGVGIGGGNTQNYMLPSKKKNQVFQRRKFPTLP